MKQFYEHSSIFFFTVLILRLLSYFLKKEKKVQYLQYMKLNIQNTAKKIVIKLPFRKDVIG